MRKEQLLHVFDQVFLKVMAVLWRVVKVFDPKPLQEHFAARPSAKAIKMARVYRAGIDDAGQSICRVSNSLIKSETNPKGLFERNQLIKIYNPANKHFVVLYVMGAGSLKISRNMVSLDYDACRNLGVTNESRNDGEVELLMGKANVGDSEYFHMYTDSDKSSRSGRVLGWIMFAYGLWIAGLEIVEQAFAAFMALLGLM